MKKSYEYDDEESFPTDYQKYNLLGDIDDDETKIFFYFSTNCQKISRVLRNYLPNRTNLSLLPIGREKKEASISFHCDASYGRVEGLGINCIEIEIPKEVDNERMFLDGVLETLKKMNIPNLVFKQI